MKNWGFSADGDDARIEARSLKIEARASSVQKRHSIRASTTMTGLSSSPASLPLPLDNKLLIFRMPADRMYSIVAEGMLAALS
jgi:hypothetical protein